MKPDPRRVAGIQIIFHFPENITAEQKQKTILENTAHTCPVMRSIHPDIEVEVMFNW